MADTDQKKSIAVKTVDDISNVWHTAMDSDKGIGLANVFHSVVESVKSRFDKAMSYFYDDDYSDNIYVLNGTKTLTGQDFSELYDGNTSVVTKSTDKGEAQFLKPDVSYSTEMYQYGTQSNNAEYNVLPLDSKIIYETTMLTKKFANRYASKQCSAEDALNSYKNEMDKYKSICESNNITWNDIIMAVSNEVQTESCHFIQDRNKSDLNMSNLAHNLLLSYAGPDYKDTEAPDVNSEGVTYDDTLSLDNEFNDSLFDKIKRTASQGIHKAALGVGNAAHGVWSGIKNATEFVKSGIEDIQFDTKDEDDYADYGK